MRGTTRFILGTLAILFILTVMTGCSFTHNIAGKASVIRDEILEQGIDMGKIGMGSTSGEQVNSGEYGYIDLGSLKSDTCAAVDSEYFNAAVCKNDCSADEKHLEYINDPSNPSLTEFPDCASVGNVCCLAKPTFHQADGNLPGGYNTFVDPMRTVIDKDTGGETRLTLGNVAHIALMYPSGHSVFSRFTNWYIARTGQSYSSDPKLLQEHFAYWDLFHDYFSDKTYCDNNPQTLRIGSCTGDWDHVNCSVSAFEEGCHEGSYEHNDEYYHYAQKIDQEFFCNRYSNVICVEDGTCNRENPLSCKMDSDCWPAGSTEEQKDSICNAACLRSEKTTCVPRSSDGAQCTPLPDYDGNVLQHGYQARMVKQSDSSTLGCEGLNTASQTYDCCLKNNFALKELDAEGKFTYEIAYETDGVLCERNKATTPTTGIYRAPGNLGREETYCIWTEDEYFSTSYPCAGTPCAHSLNGLDDYKKCFGCMDLCGIGECCNGIDDDGDGTIDGDDAKCHTGKTLDGIDVGMRHPEEGGVCYE